MTGRSGNTEIVSDGLKQARRALGRGAADEALVLLWNALESARLAGDRWELGIIERLALHSPARATRASSEKPSGCSRPFVEA
jgi:hypothetical protein